MACCLMTVRPRVEPAKARVQGAAKGAEYFAGYILEQSLSVDNLFVFILVFKYFRVPREDQDKVRALDSSGRVQHTCPYPKR